jgi:outer membrane protein OmpA-like peptidoglycan-associated protein
MIKTLKVVIVGVVLGSGLTNTFANTKNAQSIEFPELSKSYLKAFQRYTVQDLKLLSVGLNKDQVRHILGVPSFNEGIFAVRTWNYIVDVQNPINNTFKRCQLRIDFDQKYLTKAFYWKGEECQELLKYGAAQEKPVVLPKPDNSVRQANIFFQFDRSELEGAMSNMSLIEIVQAIKKSNSTRITIQGYADTLGNGTYNQRLSEHRTNSIASYLIAQGIPSQYILVDARGSTEQYKRCESEASHAEKISCLAPNRRVSISW